MVKCWNIFLWDQEQGEDICYHHFNIVLDVPISASWEEKELKGFKKENKCNCHYAEVT